MSKDDSWRFRICCLLGIILSFPISLILKG